MVKLSLKKKYTTIKNCRVCGSSSLSEVLFLGEHPLANSFKKSPYESEIRYPLTLVFCQKCSLVQLKETVKKEVLFNRYLWVTGTSKTARIYADIFYKQAINIIKAKPSWLIVEIGSNDGTFLAPFLKAGYKVLGVEPAKNIAEIAKKTGIETINRYWDRKTAKEIIEDHGEAKVIIARNVIPHVNEIHDVIHAIKRCMSDDGVGVIEFHYAGIIHQELQYDSIYHEHLCYFSMKSIKKLLNKHGLFPFHIGLSPISGGSYVIYFSKKSRKESPVYKQLSAREAGSSLNEFSSWKKFAGDCLRHRDVSVEILRSSKGKRIVGFGSSARSSTYLNFCSFSSEVRAIIDNNRLKQGLYSPGSSIPIVSGEAGFKLKPELLFILAWNFKDEIIAECRNRDYRGDYLIPFPNMPYIVRSNEDISYGALF